jgi:hypothetical protein
VLGWSKPMVRVWTLTRSSNSIVIFFAVASHAGRSCLDSLILESFRLSPDSQPSGSILSSVPGRVQPK